MKKVPVEEAVGMVLCHDLTQIIPGKFKGRAFAKGHVVTAEDIPRLRDMGKEHLFVWESGPGMLHENEAARRLAAAIAGEGIAYTEPNQGKVNLSACCAGLLQVRSKLLHRINEVEQVVCATRHDGRSVNAGEIVAATRVVPLVIATESIEQVEAVTAEYGPVIDIKPFRQLKVGMVTTGNEVWSGRIKDGFSPIVVEKLKVFNAIVDHHLLVPDQIPLIAAAIREMVEAGMELVLVTGGMSVDPDDVTPAGVRAVGAEIVTYGVPVLPGSMLLVAYLEGVPVIGLPGCVMYDKVTVFDLILPRIFAGETIKREELLALGHGGLCLECQECHFPNCPFGQST